jgi:predicted signal transduction protein with EAL and GGDEF domain
VALGRSLDITTVAEGIETIEQAERMRALGCTYGQGYLFSRPLAGAQFRAHPAEADPAAVVETGIPAGEPAPRKRRPSRSRLAPNPSAG